MASRTSNHRASDPALPPGGFVGVTRGVFSDFYQHIPKGDEPKTELGHGAEGNAYLVMDKNDRRRYVAKEVHQNQGESKKEHEAKVRRLKEEFKKLVECSRHLNIVRVVRLIEDQGFFHHQAFIIVEAALGGDLRKYMQRVLHFTKKGLSEQWIAGAFKQAMTGVSYLHENQIVHNDIKPDNILVLEAFSEDMVWEDLEKGRVPTVAIADFGCATLYDDTEWVGGDPRYLSPEAWVAMERKEPKKMDGKTDIWAMAVCLYELLSGGKLPFLYRALTGMTKPWQAVLGIGAQAVNFQNAVKAEAVIIKKYCPEISEEAVTLLKDMFEKDPTYRPTAREVIMDPTADKGYRWFQDQVGSNQVTQGTTNIQQELALNTTKGWAHRYLLNHIATTLEREHGEKCLPLFNKIATNGSQTIDFNAYKEALAKGILKDDKFAPGVDDEELSIQFKKLDLKGNGRLDFYEFVAAFFPWKSLGPKELERKAKDFFDRFSDGDKCIDKLGLNKIFGKGTLTKVELDEVFSRMDTDRNRKITVEEFKDFLFAKESEEEAEKRHHEEFARTKPVRDTENCVEFCGNKVVLPGMGICCLAWFVKKCICV